MPTPRSPVLRIISSLELQPMRRPRSFSRSPTRRLPRRYGRSESSFPTFSPVTPRSLPSKMQKMATSSSGSRSLAVSASLRSPSWRDVWRRTPSSALTSLKFAIIPGYGAPSKAGDVIKPFLEPVATPDLLHALCVHTASFRTIFHGLTSRSASALAATHGRYTGSAIFLFVFGLSLPSYTPSSHPSVCNHALLYIFNPSQHDICRCPTHVVVHACPLLHRIVSVLHTTSNHSPSDVWQIHHCIMIPFIDTIPIAHCCLCLQSTLLLGAVGFKLMCLISRLFVNITIGGTSCTNLDYVIRT